MSHKPIPVIFRIYRGELTAYLPTMAWSRLGVITCYAHVGQHGGACRSWLQKGRPAKPEEYADLLAEMTGIYDDPRDPEDERVKLVPIRRCPPRGSARWHWEDAA